jgi:NADP-dependent 3-hydroxy acid dehydrogenase YdfG
MTDIGGQVALVTGATGGFGSRMCKVLASHGADVAICGRRIDRMEELAHELHG